MIVDLRLITLSVCIVFLAGCNETPTFYLGQWKINQEDLAESIEKNYPGDAQDLVDIKNQLKEMNANDEWILGSDNSYKHNGAFPSHGTYSIYSSAEDWVVIRLKPQDDSRDDHNKLNEMTIEQLIEYKGVVNGPAPALIRFKKMSDSKIKAFFLLVEDRQLTDNTEYLATYDAVTPEGTEDED